MSKKFFAMVMALGLMISVVGGVSADGHQFPAQNEGACADAAAAAGAESYEFKNESGVRTCSFEGAEFTEEDNIVRKWAGKSGRSWSQDVIETTQTSATYTRDGSDLQSDVTVNVVTTHGDCYNPGGNVVDASESDHCLSN